MKTKIFLTILLSFFFFLLASQVPQGFNYQAIVRDPGSGAPIIGQLLPVRITIKPDSSGTAVIWQELHSSVISDNFGVISLVLGKGSRQAVSTVATFNDIDWSITPKFIAIEIDYNGWKSMGITRMWSVPYATVAGDLAGSLKSLSVEGKTSDLEEALFEVKNKDNQTIFAVYNEGVRIYVDNGAKGNRGGFAVGGFDMTKQTKKEYMVVTEDSIRLYIDDNPLTKGQRGGFAVGGYDLSKGIVQNYLDVSADSVRIFIDDAAVGKGKRGGFAVGGFDQTKGVNNYLNVIPSPDNYFFGENSGANTTGFYNSFIGFETGFSNTTGSDNAFFGYQGGYKNTTGSGNLFVGYQSGFNNTDGYFNSFLGYKAGYSNSSGDQNTFLGSNTGLNNTSGRQNTFVGFDAGYSNTTGSYNNFFGTQSGRSNTTGNYNTFIGPLTGYSNKTGRYNSFMGYKAGNANLMGESNVYIGYEAGAATDSSMNNVFIGHRAGASHSTETQGSNSGGNVYIGSNAGQNDYAGARNVFVGWQAGMENTTGYSNVFISSASGWKNTTGYSNVLVGDLAGVYNTTGYENVIIGRQSGLSNTTGYRNVFIGYNAGNGVEGSNRLCIGSGDASGSLIYGEFDNKLLRINGNLNISNNLTFANGGNRYLSFPDPLFTLYLGGQPGVSHAPYALSLVTEGPSSIGNIGLIIIGSSQNVGIGTTSPAYKLDVTGSIRATGSVYYGGTAGNANGTAYTKPDYVFDRKYDFISTSKVADFVKKEKHLPWITSADKEKKENGDVINMTRMSFETLETVENLQLQLIEQQKLIDSYQTEIKALREDIEKIKTAQEKGWRE